MSSPVIDTTRFAAGERVPDWIERVEGEADLFFTQSVNVERHADGSVTVHASRPDQVLRVENKKPGSCVVLRGAPTRWEVPSDPFLASPAWRPGARFVSRHDSEVEDGPDAEALRTLLSGNQGVLMTEYNELHEWRTASALARKGWLDAFALYTGTARFTLTQAGRAALEGDATEAKA